MGTIALIIVCSILIVVGLVGVVLPILPGIPLSWLGLFIYTIGTGFDRISITTVAIFFILMVLTLVLDFGGQVILFRSKIKKEKGASIEAPFSVKLPVINSYLIKIRVEPYLE